MFRRSSRRTVDGARPRCPAMRRIESPRSTPAKISSRSPKDRYRRPRGFKTWAGITPPACLNQRSPPRLWRPAAVADRLDHARLFLRVLRKDLARHPVQLVDLAVAWLVEDELVDARFDVRLEHAVEGVLRPPRIQVGLRHPVIEGAVEGVGVASDLPAVVVEHLVAFAHLLRR